MCKWYHEISIRRVLLLANIGTLDLEPVLNSPWLGSVGKESACNAGDTGGAGSIPGSGRYPGGGKWQPTPGNPVDSGTWQVIIQRITMSQT